MQVIRVRWHYFNIIWEAIHIRLHIDNINKDNGLKFQKIGCLQSNSTTAFWYNSRPLGTVWSLNNEDESSKSLQKSKSMIEMHQSLLILVLLMLIHSQSTSSSSDDKQQYSDQEVAINTVWFFTIMRQINLKYNITFHNINIVVKTLFHISKHFLLSRKFQPICTILAGCVNNIKLFYCII